MPPKFGTSGLRGLVAELTPDLIGAHVMAFVASCPVGNGIWIGRDLRGSSPAISKMVANAASAMGVQVTDAGAVPTPALALASMNAGCAAVMVTGSHIPDDRNGIKFYTPDGEITKAHETAILANLDATPTHSGPEPITYSGTEAAYIARYTRAYGTALAGMRIGVYSHSAVGRDLMVNLLTQLGAKITELGRATHFVPVDTEAVPEDVRAQLRAWASSHPLDAIVSTDGDGDRPLVADATGTVVPGDVLGQITGTALGAQIAVTPVSSNSGAEQVFEQVIRTRIGSPFVIAGMEAATGRVVGYEANGGFLLGYDANGPAGPLPTLMTRDAVLPILASLMAAKAAGSLAAAVATQPPRFTAADRLQGVATETAQAFIADLSTQDAARAAFLKRFDLTEAAVDRTDGLRMICTGDRIVHLRPSGNAPELRFYAEADSAEAAQALLDQGLDILRAQMVG
ncbi:phosphomannomutase [uncultured Sulfitobacter sp.]|jgi:phosphomannomutase|uniref:phosphomannomutase n=1 Tax=uncultured Sulfitobacter sp. TaxID=191468 RepID=UPI0025D7274A|nr:phosphomannomutase [uncultured Sulfitobacter sp.]